jgi:hypothetical protein
MWRSSSGALAEEGKKLTIKGIYKEIFFIGADDQNRTGDLLITNQLLYRLSYIGIHPLIFRQGAQYLS